MAKLASPVADGQVAVATQYNNLLHDLFQEHAHTGDGDGGVVPHGSTSDGDITSPTATYHTHANLRTHLMGTGTEFVDQGGGKVGVHGLPDWAQVMGGRNDQYVVQMGLSTTDASETIADPGNGDWHIQTTLADIGFQDAFEAVADNPKIFITVLDSLPAAVAVDTDNYDHTGFRPLIWFPLTKSHAKYNTDFLWIAFGTM
jgi:hypothetical protein